MLTLKSKETVGQWVHCLVREIPAAKLIYGTKQERPRGNKLHA